MLIDPPHDSKPQNWTQVPPREPYKSLKETLSPQELRAIQEPAACEAVVLSYKAELSQAHKETGAWELRAVAAEKKLLTSTDENARLRHDLEKLKEVNRKLHKTIYHTPAESVGRV